MKQPDISIVIPLLNEEESLPELAAWIERVMVANNFEYEVLLIDDGSNDNSWKIIEGLSSNNPSFKGIKFRRNYGKSAALNVGFESAQGDVVFTMDADLQDSPEELPAMYNMIKNEDYDLVSGWKKRRYDPMTKTIPTKLYNWATRKMSNVPLHDFNCGLKAYRNEVIKNIEIYGEMHRYIPAVAKWAGFSKIGEKVVQHQARKYGETKFGLNRFINGPLDLLSITFVSKFGKKPMHLFGFLGTIVFLFGFSFILWLGIEKFYYLQQHVPQSLLTDRPQFYISLTCMILGTQLFLAGFLAEMISRNSSNRNFYQIAERTDSKM